MSEKKSSGLSKNAKVEIGERLKEFRQRMGMKSQDLAEAIGVSPVSLSRYENGHQSMESWVLIRLAQVFGCDLNWFLLGIGEPLLSMRKDADIKGDFFMQEIINRLKADPDAKQVVYEMLHCGDSIGRFMEITKSYLTQKTTSSKAS